MVFVISYVAIFKLSPLRLWSTPQEGWKGATALHLRVCDPTAARACSSRNFQWHSSWVGAFWGFHGTLWKVAQGQWRGGQEGEPCQLLWLGIVGKGLFQSRWFGANGHASVYTSPFIILSRWGRKQKGSGSMFFGRLWRRVTCGVDVCFVEELYFLCVQARIPVRNWIIASLVGWRLSWVLSTLVLQHISCPCWSGEEEDGGCSEPVHFLRQHRTASG